MFGRPVSTPTPLPWAWALHRLVEARTYWICTTRPDGRPHARPMWGLWLDDVFSFRTGSPAAANLAVHPQITMHVDSGSEVVIVEGEADVATPARAEHYAQAYELKYHWPVDPADPHRPIRDLIPHVVFGWLSDPTGLDGGAAFHATPTRWHFDP